MFPPHVGRRLRLRSSVIAAALLASTPAVARAARDLMAADGPGNTYQLLERSYGIEVPDCMHMVPHMTEEMDDELGKQVFVFHAHVRQDDDRCMNSDRQRTEIRGRGPGVQGPLNSTRHYRWKMKLPNGFQPSGNFTHVFQIKAYGNGHGSGAPIMTLTPRNGSFGIDGRIGTRASTQLSQVVGHWVVIELTIVHANAGRLTLNVRRLRDNMGLISYSGTADMYDDGAGYGAPKFGIYRSLNSAGSLRDEQVRFADFCVSDTSLAECADGDSPSPADAGNPPPPADAGWPTDAASVEAGAGGAGGAAGGGGSVGTGGSAGGAGAGGGAGANPGSGGLAGAAAGGSGGGGAGGAAGGGGSGGGGSAGSGSSRTPSGSSSGGGCAVGGEGSTGPLLGLALAALTMMLLRRRRR